MRVRRIRPRRAAWRREDRHCHAAAAAVGDSCVYLRNAHNIRHPPVVRATRGRDNDGARDDNVTGVIMLSSLSLPK